MRSFGLFGSLVWIAASAALSCAPDPPGGSGRIGLALSPQLDADDIQATNISIYEAGRVTCDGDSGAISGDTSIRVLQELGLAVAGGPIELTLPTGGYVISVEAGPAAEGGGLDYVLAQGCAQLVLNGDRDVEIMLHAVSTCGDGVVDPGEQCDDDTPGCDRCQTVPQWVNSGGQFLVGEQDQPRAAGAGDEIAVCWRSENAATRQLPMAWYDREGQARIDPNPFVQTGGDAARDCHALDLRSGRLLVAYQQEDVGDSFLSIWNGTSSAPRATSQIVPATAPPRDVAAVFTRDQFGVLATVESGEIDLYRFSFSGTILAIEHQMLLRFTTFEQSAPALAGRDDEGFIVAWVEGEGAILARIYSRIEGEYEVERQEPICEHGEGCESPAVGWVRRSDGDHYLVAFREADDGQIAGVWFTPEGTAEGPFLISAAEGCSNPAVAPLPRGFVVAWSQVSDDGNRAVFARVVMGADVFGGLPTGSALTGDPLRISPEDRADCDQPALATSEAVDGVTAVMIFYRDARGSEGNGPDIARRIVNVGQGT